MTTYLKPFVRVLQLELDLAFLNGSGSDTGIRPTIDDWEQDPIDYGVEL